MKIKVKANKMIEAKKKHITDSYSTQFSTASDYNYDIYDYYDDVRYIDDCDEYDVYYKSKITPIVF